MTDVRGRCVLRIEDLVRNFPKLFHMAEEGSWPNIEKHGLLSTSALLTRYGYSGTKRANIESEWRPNKITICCDGLENAVIRDQIPMPPDALGKCLVGMTPNEWYKSINSRIFFWTTWKSLEILISAKEYKNNPHIVITVDTRRLLERYTDLVTLSSINSGSTYYDPERYSGPKSRGSRTFQTIGDYNFPYITELVVEEGIKDIATVTISVERWIAHRVNYSKPTFEKLANIWP